MLDKERPIEQSEGVPTIPIYGNFIIRRVLQGATQEQPWGNKYRLSLDGTRPRNKGWDDEMREDNPELLEDRHGNQVNLYPDFPVYYHQKLPMKDLFIRETYDENENPTISIIIRRQFLEDHSVIGIGPEESLRGIINALQYYFPEQDRFSISLDPQGLREYESQDGEDKPDYSAILSELFVDLTPTGTLINELDDDFDATSDFEIDDIKTFNLQRRSPRSETRQFEKVNKLISGFDLNPILSRFQEIVFDAKSKVQAAIEVSDSRDVPVEVSLLMAKEPGIESVTVHEIAELLKFILHENPTTKDMSYYRIDLGDFYERLHIDNVLRVLEEIGPGYRFQIERIVKLKGSTGDNINKEALKRKDSTVLRIEIDPEEELETS